jgi:hypothetical protein
MAGSEAEERIRTKVEAALRAEHPDARIVHELNTEQMGVRLDLASVRANALAMIEIKSERDVLKRLQSQLAAALKVTGDVRVYAAEKHRAALLSASREHKLDADGKTIMVWSEDGRRGSYIPNPDFIRETRRARILIETDDGFELLEPTHGGWWPRLVMEHIADPRALFEMLWAEEMRVALNDANLGAPPRASRGIMKRLALDHMTGSQIRAAVCRALRSRPFARADAARAA